MKKYSSVSVVIPAYNEGENIAPLFDEIHESLKKVTEDFEIIFVNDGSRDNTQSEINKLLVKYPSIIKFVEFRHNSGKAAALHAGFQLAKKEIIIQLDSDLQDDPSEFINFIDKINQGFDLVVGWKINRKDSFIKNNTSKIFNAATNLVSKAKLHDHNCGFKAYRAEVAKELNIYGELHRYIGVMVSSNGYKVVEIPVNHRKRFTGKTKYGRIRFINGFLDLLTIIFLTKYKSRPLHFFGYIGIISPVLGICLFNYLLVIKFIFGQPIGERPLLLFSVMLMIMGVQILVTGLVGEQITTLIYQDKPNYKIKNKSK